MKRVKKIIEWIAIVFLILVICLMGFINLAPIFGWRMCSVMSGSMEPSLRVGGMIVTRPVAFEEIKEGDIISYSIPSLNLGKGLTITHRVVKVIYEEASGKTWLQTKGDANADPDQTLIGPDSAGQIKKEIFHVPYLGRVMDFLRSKAGFFIFFMVPVLILIILHINDLRREIAKFRQGGIDKKSRS